MENVKILFEKEVCDYLRLPSLPAKEWDGKSEFANAVAVVTLLSGDKAYAVAKFNPEVTNEPSIVKVFSGEPFRSEGAKFFIVPYYMNVESVDNMDLDEQSKKHAEELIKEAEIIENEGAEDVTSKMPENEYCYPEIENDEQAVAFIKAWNQKHGIKGGVPSKHDSITAKLLAMWMEDNNDKE